MVCDRRDSLFRVRDRSPARDTTGRESGGSGHERVCRRSPRLLHDKRLVPPGICICRSSRGSRPFPGRPGAYDSRTCAAHSCGARNGDRRALPRGRGCRQARLRGRVGTPGRGNHRVRVHDDRPTPSDAAIRSLAWLSGIVGAIGILGLVAIHLFLLEQGLAGAAQRIVLGLVVVWMLAAAARLIANSSTTRF